MLRSVDVLSALGSTLVRGAAGMRIGVLGPRPAQRLELYEFEACPYCRKVREALSILDLEVLVKPCPKGGPRYREEVKRRGGRALFPFLVDPNAGKEMYESDDIIRHLFERYGDGTVPRRLSPGALTAFTSILSGLPRMGNGAFALASRRPERSLELWSFEASPYCRLVRERLCVLELPYRLHNVARGGERREVLRERGGRMQVPFLVDPNTQTELYESAAILDYLDRTYALPKES